MLYALGLDERLGRSVSGDGAHEIVPDRACRNHTGETLFHWSVIAVTDPHSGSYVRRVPHRPAVSVVVRGAGFCSHRSIREFQVSAGPSERRFPGFRVAENAGDQVRELRRNNLFFLRKEGVGFLLLVFTHRYGGVVHEHPDHVAEGIGYTLYRLRRHVNASSRQCGISVGEFQQGHLAAAQRQSKSVRGMSLTSEGLEPKSIGHLQEFLYPCVLQSFHRRYVVGIGQRVAHRHHSVLPFVVVRRYVHPAGTVRKFGFHVHDGRGRSPPFLWEHEIGQVNQRLQRRSGLSGPQGNVHLTVDGFVVVICTADHGEDFSRAGPDGHESPVRSVIRLKLMDVPLYHRLRFSLHVQVQCSVNPETASRNDLRTISLLQDVPDVQDEVRCQERYGSRL